MNSQSYPLEGVFIGIDYGEARIGVARINSLAKIGEPLQPIKNESFEKVVDELKNVISEQSATAVVVGLPRGLDGQETDQTNICRDFATKLSRITEKDIYMIDEAATSNVARQMKNPKSMTSIDSMSAALILEDFVDFPDQQALRVVVNG